MAAFNPVAVKLRGGQNALIRRARMDDAAQFLEIARSVAMEGEFVIVRPEELPGTVEEEQSWIRSYEVAASNLLLAAEVEGAIIGILAFEAGQRQRIAHRGELHISVKASGRNQGIGRLLLASLIDWAQQRGDLEKLCLSVFANNERAIALYRKMGFVEEGRCPRSIRLGQDRYVDEILMYRFLHMQKDGSFCLPGRI